MDHECDEDSSHAAQSVSQRYLDPDGEHRSCKTAAQPHMTSPASGVLLFVILVHTTPRMECHSGDMTARGDEGVSVL